MPIEKREECAFLFFGAIYFFNNKLTVRSV